MKKKRRCSIVLLSLLVSFFGFVISCGGGGGGSTRTFNIIGLVTSDGTALPGVTMTLSGAGTGTTTTDAGGNYIFSDLAPGSYVVTPSKANVAFSPPITVNVTNLDSPGVDFHVLLEAAPSCQGSTSSFFVSIGNAAAGFNSILVTVPHGQTVKWTNNDPLLNHTVTSGTSPTFDGKFDSGPLVPGGTFCVTFVEAGNTYDYFSSTDTGTQWRASVQVK